MSIYVPGRLTLRKGWQPMDPDAAAYIAAVEAADAQTLEEPVKIAIDNFVLGCKSDGIWPAIKASCILAGARTLNGALVPLAGTAPTSFNFVADDYNRKTGLVGDGSTTFLSTNATYAQLMQQNNGHISCWVSNDSTTANKVYIGGYQQGGIARDGGSRLCAHINSSTFLNETRTALTTGFMGVRRNSGANQQFRRAGGEVTLTTNSTAPRADLTINVFTSAGGAGTFVTTARLAFYSIGESLDLALLDARVTALINAFGAAIP